MTRRTPARLGAAVATLALVAGCGSSAVRVPARPSPSGTTRPAAVGTVGAPATNVYAHTQAGMLAPVTRSMPYLIYAPDSAGVGVYVIDPRTYHVVRYIPTGSEVQHVVPAWDLRMLYATNDTGNSLTPISPFTGQRAGPNIPVTDPYNMYFTPDGRHAIVVEEARRVLAFRDPHTFRLQKAVPVPCAGVDHMDFSADGTFLVASCEFNGTLLEVDLRTETVTATLSVGGSPQDVKLSPDGSTFYVANRWLGGVQLVDAHTFRLAGFIRTGADAHGLYVSRDTRDLYVSNRAGGSISVISFAERRVVETWRLPGTTPDMGGVSPDGTVLWLAGRYRGEVYAISTVTGRLLASIPAGSSPHGLCVWPQPGRYSTGHTGVMR